MTKEEHERLMKDDVVQSRLLTKAEIAELQNPKVNYSDYVEPTIIGVVLIFVLGLSIRSIWNASRRIREREQENEKQAAQQRERARRPSQVITDRKSQTETVYRIPEVVKVTAKTDLSTRRVLIEWEFNASLRQRKIEFWYTDTPDALERANRLKQQMDSDEDGLIGFLSTFAQLGDMAQKTATALEKGDERSAMKHAPQVFAPTATTINDDVEKVLPEGVWYIQVKIEADDIEDSFVYTANLDKLVREAATRQAMKKPAEVSAADRIAEDIKKAVDSMQSAREVLGQLSALETQCASDLKISKDELRYLLKEIQARRESMLRKLRE